MKVRIKDHTRKSKMVPSLLKFQDYEFAWRYEQGKYQLSKYPTPTCLFDSSEESSFMSGEEVWIHKDEVSIQIIS
tara:strand:+ start:360 stop:584 length:225 start_codon:yes stop_codon:yes gene_type:complete